MLSFLRRQCRSIYLHSNQQSLTPLLDVRTRVICTKISHTSNGQNTSRTSVTELLSFRWSAFLIRGLSPNEKLCVDELRGTSATRSCPARCAGRNPGAALSCRRCWPAAFCDDHVLRQKWQSHSLPTDAIDGVIGQVRCLQPNALDTAPQRLAEVEGAASVMDARQHLTDCRPQGRLEVRHDRLHRLHCPFLTLYCLHCHLPSCHCHLQCCYFRFQNRRLAHCNLTKTTNQSL